MEFHALRIKNTIQETSDTYSLVFDIGQDIFHSYHHLAGQYVTIRAEVNGKEIRRPYSINSMPSSPDFSVSVKKVKGGIMSNFLPSLQVGDLLEVSLPEGHFTLTPDHTKIRAHYFVAAGSGITPVMSMIQTVLEEEPKSICYLLYGSRNEDSIIFKTRLHALSSKYSGQLQIRHVLSRPKQIKAGGIGGLFGKKETGWKGEKGRIDDKILTTFLTDFPSRAEEKHFYLCGPGDMISKAENCLTGQSVDQRFIHKEFFTPASSGKNPDKGAAIQGKSAISVMLKGKTYAFDMEKSKIILDQLVERKLDPPYSCTSGACSTCIAKVTEGQVKMDACYALDPDEVEAGYILTCQARPVTDEVVLTYDV
jgi:ring-1,2-phenylacetyl-CoA epoxidase subunit PaaE